jgi:CrcB protein
MGLLAGYGAFVAQLPEHWRVFLMVGVLGGLTTFSAFSLDFLTLMERGQLALAAGYVLGSVFLSLLAVFAGLGLVKALA